MIETLLNSAHISGQARAEFLSFLDTIHLKRNEFYLKENQISNRIGFIEKGMLKQYYNVDGEERIRWVLIEGDIAISFSSFIKKTPSKECIQAVEKTTIYCISKENWLILSNKHLVFQNLWASKLEEIFIGIEERLYDFIYKPSDERYEGFRKSYPALAKRIPLKYLASMLGISPQHLSRIRKHN